MKIGVIGAGNIGSALAGHFRRLGHSVLITNSRGRESLSQVAQETGATPVDISETARRVDLLVIAIPMKSVPSLPKDLLSGLPASSPIVDTGNYYPLRDGAIPEIESGMIESEWTSRVLGRPVIKAFNSIVADSLLHQALRRGSKGRIALPVSGDDLKSKQRVMALVDKMGFDVIDAGPLSESWRYQPGTPAYCPDPTIDQLPVLLRRAIRDKAPCNRDQAAKIMAKLPLDFSPQELVRVARLSAGLDTWKPKSWIAVCCIWVSRLCGLNVAPLVRQGTSYLSNSGQNHDETESPRTLCSCPFPYSAHRSDAGNICKSNPGRQRSPRRQSGDRAGHEAVSRRDPRS